MTNPRLTLHQGGNPELITAPQAAELLAVDVSTIAKWIADDWIPYVELPTMGSRHSYRIPLQGLLSVLSDNDDLTGELRRLDDVTAQANVSSDELSAALMRHRSDPATG